MPSWVYLLPVIAVVAIVTTLIVRRLDSRRTTLSLDSADGETPTRKFIYAVLLSAFKRNAARVTVMVEDVEPGEADDDDATTVTDVWIEAGGEWERLCRAPRKFGRKVNDHLVELCGVEPVYRGHVHGRITVHTKKYPRVQCSVEFMFRGPEAPNIAIELEYDDRVIDGDSEPKALPN